MQFVYIIVCHIAIYKKNAGIHKLLMPALVNPDIIIT